VYAFSSGTHEELWSRVEQTPYQGVTFGFSLAAAGDWDGDGRSELAVGIPGTTDWHGQSIGAVSVLTFGGGVVAHYEGYAGWDYFGYSVAGLGDVNGDGRPDLAVGAPTELSNGQGANIGYNRVHLALSNHLRQWDHCPLSTNSTGAAATIAAEGLGKVTLNDLTLSVADAPPGQVGIFRCSRSARRAP
jgi:hypothetical protein